MNRHIRVWFWKSVVGEFLAIASVEAKERAARACGRDDCRSVYDEAFREQLTAAALDVLRRGHVERTGRAS